MIQIEKDRALVSNGVSSLLFFVNEVKKVSLEYYGRKLPALRDSDSLIRKYPYAQGTEIAYSTAKRAYSLNQAKMILSTSYKGDMFSPSLVLKRADLQVFDFVFEGFQVHSKVEIPNLVTPRGASEVLEIALKESVLNVKVSFFVFVYDTVFGVATRVENLEEEDLTIESIASMQIPLVNEDYHLLSTHGCWSGELTLQREKLQANRVVLESLSGLSSNRHNPFFALVEENGNEEFGEVYGFNLIYSGNFKASIEMDSFSSIRVQHGLGRLNKTLKRSETFFSPMAITTYSYYGLNGMSFNFHHFVNESIIPVEFQYKERRVCYNNWEATSFAFDQGKIHSLMKKAQKLGIELFVLDDGWFKNRNDDKAGLGDWVVDKKKLPQGLNGLAEYAKKLGMAFGIWMEPEMVNADSDLYRKHPDWVIHDGVHERSEGRNQLVLDLSKREVQDYIVSSVCSVLESADISYLKWDYNRTISDIPNNPSFYFDYVVGLYSVLRRIREKHSDVLIENCASGGNRFDLGMLSFFPQSWLSDDTDSYQRLIIQEGAMLGYPLSTLSNHVSAKVSNQMMRYTSFDTKFDTACFGVLGYELDLDDLSKKDAEVIKRQIAFYKEHRRTFQWGKASQTLYALKNEKMFQVSLDGDTVIGQYKRIQLPYPKEGHLKAFDLDPEKMYEYKTRQEVIPLRKFGSLVNYVSPVHINPDGVFLVMLEKHIEMKSEVDCGCAYGSALMSKGVVLSQEWSGVGYDENIRLISDFGSRLYEVKERD